MGRQRSQIEVVEQQISVVDHDMEILLDELGRHLLNLPQPVVTEDTAQDYQHLEKEKSILDDYDAHIINLQQIGQSLNDAHARILQLKESIRHSQHALRVVYGRIGVISWEEATSHVLSDVIRKEVPIIDEMQQKVATLKRTRETASQRTRESASIFKIPNKFREAMISHKLSKFTKGHEAFFIELGNSIAASSCIKQLHSNAAFQLDTEYHAHIREIGVWEEEIAILQQRISSDKGKLEQEGVAGSFERKILDLQGLRKQQAEQVRRLSITYARKVCAQENPWKAVDVNADTLRCYDQIRRHERIRAQLEVKIEELSMEQQIGELISLIEQDEERIQHLRQLIDQHNQQIEEIQKTISQHRERIVELKKTLASSLEREEVL